MNNILKPNKKKPDTQKEWKNKIKKRLNKKDKLSDDEIRFILFKLLEIK